MVDLRIACSFNMGSADSMASKIKSFRERLEEKPLDQTPCVVAGYSKFSNSMVKTEVAYVPDQACKEAYCIHDPANCLVYPKAEFLMCYKSLQFVDLCPSDRGAAVYCENFDKDKKMQVVGILTTAINCGAKNLPCLYTSVEMVARLFKRAARRDFEPGP
uniref:Peptidase S1 domain-containing protein n=1 Tax=Lygus hesperus TaxID=30085 RepID=A0A0K8S4N6_LYGHE